MSEDWSKAQDFTSTLLSYQAGHVPQTDDLNQTPIVDTEAGQFAQDDGRIVTVKHSNDNSLTPLPPSKRPFENAWL